MLTAAPHRRPSAFAAALAALVATLAGAPAALADHVEPSLAQWSGPVLDPDSPLRVESESIVLSCRSIAGGAACDFQARSVLVNPGADPSSGTVMFYAGRASSVAFTIGDRKVAPTAGDTARFDDVVAHLTDMDATLARHAVAVDVEAGARVEIGVTGTLGLGPSISYDLPLVIPAVQARHPLLQRDDTSDRSHVLHYLASPAARWTPAHRLVVRLTRPPSWSSDGSLWFLGKERSVVEDRSKATEAEGAVEQVYMHEGPARAGARGILVAAQLTIPHALPLIGGPFVAIGGTLGQGIDLEGFRGRIGWEIAAPRWLFESVSVETDFRRRVVVTPALEAMSPQLFFLPAIGVGAGVPIQLLPSVTPGIRLQASLQVFFVGFTATVDIFPGLPASEGVYQTSLMGRVSL